MSKKVYVKPYPKEFREQLVQLGQLGDRSALEVAREFEISVDSVRRWVQQAERDQGRRQDGLSSPEREELVRLRRLTPSRVQAARTRALRRAHAAQTDLEAVFRLLKLPQFVGCGRTHLGADQRGLADA